MMREAGPEDTREIEQHLARFPATTMFLRGNLAAHGVGWTDHDHSTRYFLWVENARLSAVFGLARGGYLMAEASEAGPDAFTQFARRIPSITVQGMTGEGNSVSCTLEALGFANTPYKVRRDEPLMHSDFSELPEATLKLRRPIESDQSLLSELFVRYELDTGLSTTIAQARVQLPERMHRALAPETTVRLGIDCNGEACAMAALNAEVADLVQVGGVFVPQSRRCQGLGRGVTTARLHEARRGGAKQAILFAANEAAERAYKGIGFSNIGTYRIALFETPQTVERPS